MNISINAPFQNKEDNKAIIISTILLMIPAFYNAYPLVYADTGTYISSGLELIIPKDRPIMYGLFIRLTSLKKSLWLVIFFQSLITSYILWNSYQLFSQKKQSNLFILIICLLTAFTGIGWYSSQIMPDIYTSISILCVALLLYNKKFKIHQNILFTFVLIFSINVHFSNFAITTLLLLLVLFLYLFVLSSKIKNDLNFKYLIIALTSSLLLASGVNYLISKTFKFNQGSHAFLMGRLIDNGILYDYLQETCTNNPTYLCEFKDQLPKDSKTFLWDYSSPLYKNGGWEETSETFNKLILEILSKPKFLTKFIYTSVTASASQLIQNDVGSGLVSKWYESPTSPPYSMVNKYFLNEFNQYIQSRQNTNLWKQRLDFTFINTVNNLLLLGSAFIILIYLLYNPKFELTSIEIMMLILVLGGIIFNACVTASLANVFDRLQARVSWMLVYVAILLTLSQSKNLLKTIYSKLENKSH